MNRRAGVGLSLVNPILVRQFDEEHGSGRNGPVLQVPLAVVSSGAVPVPALSLNASMALSGWG